MHNWQGAHLSRIQLGVFLRASVAELSHRVQKTRPLMDLNLLKKPLGILAHRNWEWMGAWNLNDLCVLKVMNDTLCSLSDNVTVDAYTHENSKLPFKKMRRNHQRGTKLIKQRPITKSFNLKWRYWTLSFTAILGMGFPLHKPYIQLSLGEYIHFR